MKKRLIKVSLNKTHRQEISVFFATFQAVAMKFTLLPLAFCEMQHRKDQPRWGEQQQELELP